MRIRIKIKNQWSSQTAASIPIGAILASAETASLLQVVAQLYEVASPDIFPEQLLKGLRGVIPFEVGGCHVIDRDYRMVSACIQPESPLRLSRQEEFRRLAHLHPLNQLLVAHPARAFMLSDVLSLKEFLATEIYSVLYRPLRVNRELVAMIPDGSGGPGGSSTGGFLRISLRRWGRDFSEQERAQLNLLLPLIRRARQQLDARTVAIERLGLERFTDESAFYEWTRSGTRWQLTRRESDVLFWLSQGKTNAEIGRILGMAERTAETHALRSYPKIGVENRHGAIALVTRQSLLG